MFLATILHLLDQTHPRDELKVKTTTSPYKTRGGNINICNGKPPERQIIIGVISLPATPVHEA